MWDNPEAQYLQSAPNHHLQAEYFQPSDPCERHKNTGQIHLSSYVKSSNT